ncbi:MAG: hypothetical protein AB7I57_18290 [Pirellulales bacterium]
MRGIRGLKKCPGEDLVWGTLGHAASPPDEAYSTVKRYDAACKVRVKVTPYAADVGPIARGTAPPWYVGEPVQFPRSVRNTFQPASGSRNKSCLGSRVAYRDGKQVVANYLFVGDDALGGAGLVYWHQLDIATNFMSSYLLALPDGDGSFGYGSGEDTHSYGNTLERFYDVGDPFYQGYGIPDSPGHTFGDGWSFLHTYRQTTTTVGNSKPLMSSRPGGWSAGLRYLSFSGYFNSDGYLDGSRHGVVRFDNTVGDPMNSWYAITSTIWDPAIRFALVRPSIRTHLRSSVANDEPWWIAYDRSTNRLGTGCWRARNGPSLNAEIENVIPLPSGAQLGPNILCYNRLANGRDLILIRDAATIFPGGAGGSRSSLHWIYDGDEWIPIGDKPSFVTADKDGNLLYGHRRLIRKLGGGGWSLPGTGHFGPSDGGPYVPPDEPADDPESSATPIEPAYNSPFEESFQILVSKSWIQVRGFYGDPALATAPLEHADWPDYQIADRNNSRNSQALGGDLFKCWSFSYDGTVREPHVQFHDAYSDGQPLRRIHQRMYIGRNPSESETILAGGVPWRWPKWMHTGFQNDWWGGMVEFKPWLAEYGNPFGGILSDVFISHAYNFDFDIVDVCDCCCQTGAKSY